MTAMDERTTRVVLERAKVAGGLNETIGDVWPAISAIVGRNSALRAPGWGGTMTEVVAPSDLASCVRANQPRRARVVDEPCARLTLDAPKLSMSLAVWWEIGPRGWILSVQGGRDLDDVVRSLL